MAITLYVGRIARVTNFADNFPARGKLCRIIGIGPSGTLARGAIRAEVLEISEKSWMAVFTEGELAPLSEKQCILRDRHGLPHEFADAVRNALGEISLQEYQDAVRSYTQEFFAN
jgi:hypothetical protein